MNLKNLSGDEFLFHGSISCAGCGAILSLRYALKALGRRTIVINSTGCLAVIMQQGVPKVPHWHVLFENGPAVASGIDAAMENFKNREGINLLVIAGDGATADIGLSALSAAVERGHRMIYICYDNESYMNTGGQRSGTTPYATATTTTPVGRVIKGEERAMSLRKDVAEMMIAQGCPYVATASIGYPIDYINKVRNASRINGPSYIHVHSPCPPGWGSEPKDTVKLARRAVQTGFVVLYEYINGKRRITVTINKKKPVVEYLKLQKRFGHIISDEKIIEVFERYIKMQELKAITYQS